MAIHGWDQSDIFGIHLAAEEAIVNAILHGNQLDPGKKVKVLSRVSTEVVRIEVHDEGPGFDPSTVPDCTRDDRLQIPSGRGLMLMRSFMTRIEYLGRGNIVLLEKVRPRPIVRKRERVRSRPFPDSSMVERPAVNR